MTIPEADRHVHRHQLEKGHKDLHRRRNILKTGRINRQVLSFVTAALLALSMPVSAAASGTEETDPVSMENQSAQESSVPAEEPSEAGSTDTPEDGTDLPAEDDRESIGAAEDPEENAPVGNSRTEDMTAGSDSTGPDCPDGAGDAAVREQTKEAEAGGQESTDDSAPAGQSGEDEGTDVPILLYYGDDCFLIREVSLQMEYDDRILFTDVEDLDSGLVLAAIEDQQVSSRQVSLGTVTENPDESVITIWQGGKGLLASGTGKADLLFVAPEDLADAETALDGNSLERQISAVRLHVDVQPAPLTLMYLLGQSNMEGQTTTEHTFIGGDSVMNASGTVYSTYLPSKKNRTEEVTGTGYNGYLQEGADPLSFVAESLTSSRSLISAELPYLLNAMTEEGKGKSGPDAGLAWQFNQLTGSKVWTVNAAVGGSYISQWVPAGNLYQAVLPALQAVRQVAAAEQDAGHYRLVNTLAFWQQGEFDSRIDTTEDTYLAGFGDFVEALTKDLAVEKIGLLSTRTSTGDNLTEKELDMDGVRKAQYFIAGDSGDFQNVFMVSNVNEAWTTDQGVKEYFMEVCQDGRLEYPLREQLALPETVMDVHPEIHYTQVGYNENGLTAARGMYDVVKGNYLLKSYTVTGFFRDGAGSRITEITANGTKAYLYFMTYQSPGFKRVGYKVSDTASASYNNKTGLFTFKKPAAVTLSAYDTITGKTIVSISVKFRGWYSTGGKTYYYKDYKTKATGWQTINGFKYYFSADGVQQTGWKTISGSSYYFWPATEGGHYKGTMATGWQTLNGFKYYFGTDGRQQTGWKTISGSSYYFWPATEGGHYKGTMATGWQTINGFKYYFGSNGVIQTGWQNIGGSTYYFWPKTEGGHYKGTMAKGWQTLNGFKYYFGTDGKQQTGWKTISGKTYYFWPSTAGKHYKGTMATGKQTIGGKTYNFGTDGVRR